MEQKIDSAVIRECTRLSFQGEITFPEVVGRLSAVGVERYHADLSRLEKTYHGISGGSERDALPLAAPPPIGERFAEREVQQAIAAIQRREIEYPEFLRRIMTAGTASYTVFIQGRKAIYFGRHGDFYIEPFPGQPPADR